MILSPDTFVIIVNRYLPEPHASLLNGILFGIDLKTSGEFIVQLKRAGLIHLVVLSGANIALLAAIITGLTQRVSKKISCLIVIGTIILFTVFVGPKAPIVRASIMATLTYVAIIFGRKSTPFFALILAALATLVFQSAWLTSVSFQLSYAAAFGLLVSSRFKLKTEQGKISILEYVRQELRTSLFAQLFTAPIIFLYFRQISLVAPAANVLVAWTIAPLMVLGFLLVTSGLLFPPAGWLFALPAYGLLEIMVGVIRLAAAAPYGFIQLPR